MRKLGLLILLVVGSMLVPASGAGLAPTSATFADATVADQRGDVASITIHLQNTDTATLHVEHRSYDVEVEVRDEDFDGVVTLELNTYLAGRVQDESEAYRTEDSHDSVTVTRRSERRNELLEPGEYTMRLAVDDQEKDLGQLVVGQPSMDGVLTWTAPSSFDVENADLRSIVWSVSEQSELAMDSTAVFQVRTGGVYGLLRTKSGGDATTDLLRSAADHQLEFEIEQSNANGMDPKRLDVSATASAGNLAVVTDATNESMFVVVDLSEAVFRRDGEQVTADEGDAFRAEFAVHDESGLYDQTERATAEFSIAGSELSVQYQGERVTVEPAPDQTIRGTTSLAPGTELMVKLRSPDAPFLKRLPATVDADGTFSASFDLSDVEPGEFTVRVVKDGTTLQSVDGEIVSDAATERTTTRTTAEESETESSASDADDSATTRTPRTTETEDSDSSTTVQTSTPAEPTSNAVTATEAEGDTDGYGTGVAIAALLLGTALVAVRTRLGSED